MDTFGKLFKRFNMGHCHELSEAEAEARKRVWTKKWFPRITLDMDSAVIGVIGSQEEAEKGYKPKKKGQKSYHVGSPEGLRIYDNVFPRTKAPPVIFALK